MSQELCLRGRDSRRHVVQIVADLGRNHYHVRMQRVCCVWEMDGTVSAAAVSIALDCVARRMKDVLNSGN